MMSEEIGEKLNSTMHDDQNQFLDVKIKNRYSRMFFICEKGPAAGKIIKVHTSITV